MGLGAQEKLNDAMGIGKHERNTGLWNIATASLKVWLLVGR